MKLQTIALVGRPNVGKSTIFNRLVGKKQAIIEDTPGVTRDRIYGVAKYFEHKFNVIDTGGIDLGEEKFNKEIKMQAELAIDEADVVIFIVDGKEGMTANDLAVRDILRKSNKKVIVAINKIDNNKAKDNIYDFYELGFDYYIPISGSHNIGIDELLEEATRDFKEDTSEEYSPDIVKFCVIGRPNVGKSSLVNAILNEDRAIVSDVAGTTRDSVDTIFTYEKEKFVVIDTAGMRKKGRIYEQVERYSLLRSMKAINRSDVCLIVINAEEGIIEHDKHIASYAVEEGKAVVLVVNKWDTIDNKDEAIKEFTKKVRAEFQFLSYAPIVFLSAKTKKRLHTLMPNIIKVYNNANRQIKTSLLNDVIRDAVLYQAPPSYKGRRLKIFFVAQSGVAPQKITFHVNNKGLVHFSYERYLENKIRESFDLEGAPIEFQFKNRNE
ncbi:MAG: ribosome biogenesis GTPase Der [Tenericutes bacterium]|nr:ribosome biogenesis GTPase Der [Mycoplasmatota bacterium]